MSQLKFWHEEACIPMFLNIINIMADTNHQYTITNGCNFQFKNNSLEINEQYLFLSIEN